MCQIALASAARAILALFQISLVVLIINCTPSRVITYTYRTKATSDWKTCQVLFACQAFFKAKQCHSVHLLGPNSRKLINLTHGMPWGK
jgi:hypothetical protein